MSRILTRKLKSIKAANEQMDPLLSITRNELLNDPNYSFECHRFRDLRNEIKSWTFDLLIRNMKSLYEKSNWGWNPKEKLDELNDPNAWCLLAKKRLGNQNALVGFVHFRYDLDYEIPVIYCYEIHVETNERGKGLGGRFLDVLYALAQQAKMEKVMATVFKHNPKSVQFFLRHGYVEDESNPSPEEVVDYLILSRSI